ncbi:MAG: MBOAT family protein, partial [Patescibacteria group bacterium]|nr:MBOAT family protein [Patescibacteria group bacterium]
LLYRKLGHNRQNWLLLAASYMFYSFWDWRFLSLLIISTLANFYFGLRIYEETVPKRRHRSLVAIVAINLLFLGFFKYFNFFIDNLQSMLWLVGIKFNRPFLDIVLPLGISFYTFQAMSYPIDIYRGVEKPTSNLRDFALFVAFFPQLVAGPIERARHLLPQIESERSATADNLYRGAWLFFWGLFKKIVIADNIAKFTSLAFDPSGIVSGPMALLGIYAFAVQVYADFSGYSDMARGIARTMGFDIVVNFNTPFFSRDLYEFWQRWHISLTTWVKDYVFYPLAVLKIKGKSLNSALVIMITWAIMGLWHGAAWRFILWGVYHGALLVLYSSVRPYLLRIPAERTFLSRLWSLAQRVIVFNLFSFGILFFAVNSMPQFWGVVKGLVLDIFNVQFLDGRLWMSFIGLCVPLFLMDALQFIRDDEYAVWTLPVPVRTMVYYLMIYGTILLGDFSAQQYYYFQF